MTSSTTLHLISALADPRARRSGASALAIHLESAAVFVLVPHPDGRERLISAPGFHATMPSSRGWRELLARCAVPGMVSGRVAYPTADTTANAVAYAGDGITFVVVGPRAPDPDLALAEALAAVAPLLAGMLRAEAGVVIARGELEVARQAAERAATLTRALDLARGEAEHAGRAKDEFLAMLGHELRNPLAPILTALQMLRLEGVHTHAQDVLERQVAHLLRLVDDLLDVSRITHGKIELRRERIEISSVITRAIEMARPILEQRRNEIGLEVPPRGLLVDGDPARLAQIVSNLLTNAAKYSSPGTRVNIIAELAGDATVRVTVADHGIGIEAAYLDRLFDHFVQVPQGIDRARGGLGLGLSIVRSLVEMHGGSVVARSEGVGRGSRFVVELPLTAAEPAAAPSEPIAIDITAAMACVLVVDDNTDAADLLGEVLAAHGHHVHVSHSGPDALNALASFTPAAALLDIGLPVMDGYELAHELRARLPDIRLIALTGYGQPNDRERTRAAGFDAHLTKPVSIANVMSALEELLQAPVDRTAEAPGAGASHAGAHAARATD
jgi:signal transduction histidine kinase/CheY-like chemotaxis protein